MRCNQCDKPIKHIYYACFKGKSVTSKLIKFWTRSSYSHVAVRYARGFIEVWPTGKNPLKQRWGFTNFKNHKKGTEYELWELPVESNHFDAIMSLYINLANNKTKYDWSSIFGFVLKWKKQSKKGYICSEGLWAPYDVLYDHWCKEPHEISPDLFVMLIQAFGAKKIRDYRI